MSFDKLFSVPFLALCVVVFAIAAGLSFLLSENRIEQKPQIKSDTEIVLVYFGCSTCNAANDDRIAGVLSNLSEQLREAAASKGYAFSFIGTSNEYDLDAGLEYHADIADFDEIAVGNGMKNTALQRYVWDNFDNPLSGSTPQIIVSKRICDTRTINNRNVILRTSFQKKFWPGEWVSNAWRYFLRMKSLSIPYKLNLIGYRAVLCNKYLATAATTRE